jgi:phage-related protein
MARTGNVYITITGKDNVSKTLKQVNKGLGGLQTKTVALGTAIGNVLGNLATKAISSLVDQVGSSIDKARDLNETISKTNVIFGDSSSAIEAFAATAATTFGQSKTQAMDAAAGFAVFGKSAGLSGETLVDFSTDLTGLASDIASFSNTSVEEAITAISSGLRGESLPLRKYGVLLDEATLRARALAMGLIKTTKTALTPQQKVLAAQAEILAQTSLQQGDFARTSDGLANKQRILSASVDDLQSAIGQDLLPVALELTNAFLTDVLPALKKLWPEIKKVVSNVIGFARQVGETLYPKLQQLSDFIKTEIVPAVQKFFGFLSDNRGVLVFVAGAIAGVVAALKIYNGVMAAYRLVTAAAAAVQTVLNIALAANPVGIVVLAIAALIAGLAALYFANEDVRKALDGVFKVMGDVAGVMFGALGGAIEFIAGLFGGVLSVVGEVVDVIKTLLGLIGDVVRAIANSPIGQIAGAIGGFVGNLFGGEREAGGPVAGGRAYLVGERGPELFVPGQSGSIVPNTGLAMPAMSAGGAGGVAGEIRRAFAGLGIYLDGESVGRVSDRRLAVALATTGTTGRSSGAFRYGR